jgi:hypothetical protein
MEGHVLVKKIAIYYDQKADSEGTPWAHSGEDRSTNDGFAHPNQEYESERTLESVPSRAILVNTNVEVV